MPRNARVHLKTAGQIATELGRQYRRADRGELPWQDAAAASRILRELRSMLEAGEFEQRLERIERVLEQRQPAVDGHAYQRARL